MKKFWATVGTLFVLCLGGGIAVVAAYYHGHPAPPPAARPVPAQSLSPARKFVGVAAPNVTSWSTATATEPNLVSQYDQLTSTFKVPPDGAMPFVSLATTDKPPAIVDGTDDKQIRAFAAQLVKYDKPVAVSLDAEANGEWYSYGTEREDPAEYVALYRHVHDVMEDAGAHNVVWVWTITNSGPATHYHLLNQLYPGNAFVDWVGVDGYFVGGTESTFDQVFNRVFDTLSHISNKPFLIAETSVKPGPDAGQEVGRLFFGIHSSKRILGFIWFDYNKSGSGRDDWRIEDDSAAALAFRINEEEAK